MDDPYEILGLHRGASLEEVRSRYRELAAKYHPDRGAQQWILKQLNDAYHQIEQEFGDPPRSAAFETASSAATAPQPPEASPTVSSLPNHTDFGTLLAGALVGSVIAGVCSLVFDLYGLIAIPIGCLLGAWIAYTQRSETGI